MKYVLIALLAVTFLAGQVQAQDASALKTQKDKVSYAIGLDIGRNMKKQEIDVDANLLSKGLKEGLSGEKPMLTEQELGEVMNAFRKDLMAKQQERQKVEQERQKVMGEKNKKDGAAFLAENKKKDGVVTLPSGLQYKVIKAGAGKKPKSTDSVTVNYKGTLLDGTEFDSSYKRGKPATFGVTGVIKGWTEALQLMEEGATWQLFIPAELAYGEKGPANIGSNATLIFEVELISIQEKAAQDKLAPAKPVPVRPAPAKPEEKK
jgi:FKBP-type peptidyl-prolyl cis-trans isomerase FklB